VPNAIWRIANWPIGVAPKSVKHVIRFPPCCAFLWKYVGKIGTKKLKLIAIFNLEGIELNPVST
jgi:hypothetical protein